jgi:unsaturated chondroitin disaccharide hydrolase
MDGALMTMSRRTLIAGAAVAAGGALVASPTASAADASFGGNLRSTMDYAIAKLRAVAPTVTAFPTGTKFEKYTTAADGGWVGGFWPGQLWMAYLYTNDDFFRQLAESWALKLAPRQTHNTDHDLGFLFLPSWVTAFRLTGDTSWRDGALVAAGELIKRFNEKGQFIRAWGALGTPDNAGRMIIDTMMNLDLLCWATKMTGDSKYQDIAVAHATTAQKYMVRPDNTTCHVFDFNPDTGAAIGQNTVQGYSATSCWSRGQSWGVYGFARMYLRTGNKTFLETSRRLADWTIQHITDDYIPVWDYRSPLAPNDIKDSSAATVNAAGLLDLAKLTGNPRYEAAALRFLDALGRSCLTTKSARADAVLARGTRNRPAEDGIEIGLPYADYYLMEAILRVLRPDRAKLALDL